MLAPTDAGRIDADGCEYTFEEHLIQVTSIDECEAFGEPVGTAVAVMPLCARFENDRFVTAGLGKADPQLDRRGKEGPFDPSSDETPRTARAAAGVLAALREALNR